MTTPDPHANNLPFSEILKARRDYLCPACKKKVLVESSVIYVAGFPEAIPWECIKCPDERDCGFARGI